MKHVRILSLLCLSAFVMLAGCKKRSEDYFVTPPQQSHFVNSIGNYYVTNSSTSTFKIPITLTTVSDADRKVTVSVTSPTGAAAGAQYNLASTTITIPAGKAVDSLTVNGLFAGYSGTRKDTLVFTITGGDVPASAFNNVFKLVVQKACAVVSTDLIGAYTQSTDLYQGAASTQPKYTATISNWTALSTTSASVIIKNLGATSDNGWGPFAATDAALNPGITATLDWSNPGNQTVTIATQNYFGSGASISTINGTGTFSSCDQSFTIVCSVKYAPNGNTYLHTSILKR